MSHHTPSSRQPRHTNLPMGRAKLRALEVAMDLVGIIQGIGFPPLSSHLRDHLVRAADNTVLRLAEAGGRTMGNRRQHLEAAYAECQEVQADLLLLAARCAELPPAALIQADRLGGLIYGLLRSELRSRPR